MVDAECGKVKPGPSVPHAGYRVPGADASRPFRAGYRVPGTTTHRDRANTGTGHEGPINLPSLTEIHAVNSFLGSLPLSSAFVSLEHLWASPHIVPATSAVSGPTDSGSACPPGGGVPSSAAAARRGGSSSPYGCRASTPAPDRPPPPPPPGEGTLYRFPRSQRLTRGGDLQAVRRQGKRIRTEHLDVRATASLSLRPRVGLIVPKQKRTSVERNRLKRRLRELSRTRLLPQLPPVDLVIRTLPEAYDASFDELAREIGKVGERLSTMQLPRRDTGTDEGKGERRKTGGV